MNPVDLTVTGLARRECADAVGRLLEALRHNVDALGRQLSWVAARPPGWRRQPGQGRR